MRAPIAAALLLAATAALGASALTLREATAAALEKNPAAAAARAREDAARTRLSEVRATWLPRVDVTETSTRSNDPVFVFASLLQEGRFQFDPVTLNDPDPLRANRLALNVRYTLFDQFRRLDAAQQARNGVAVSAFGADEIAQRLRAETIRAFYGVAVAEAKRSVAADAVRAGEAEAKAIRDKFEQGLIVESDLLATEVQLAEFRQQEIEAEGDAAIARATLAILLQRPVVEAIAIEGDVPSRTFGSVALEEALARGLEARGVVHAAQGAAANATLDLRMARAARLPRVDAFANWSRTGSNPDHTVAVIATMELFDGGTRARIAAARAGADAARAEESAARDRASMEIVTAWHRAHAAGERVTVAAKSVTQAETATRIVRDRYEHGLTTITEQLRAETALVRARLGLLAARYDAVTNHAELLRAMGGLHDVDAF